MKIGPTITEKAIQICADVEKIGKEISTKETIIEDSGAKFNWTIANGATLNITKSGSSEALTIDSGDSWQGTINLAGALLNLDSSYGTLDLGSNMLINDTNSTSTFTNNGATINITGDNSTFTANYRQVGGTIKSTSADMFKGLKELSSNAVMEITDPGLDNFSSELRNISLLGNSKLVIASAGGDINVAEQGGMIATFNGDNNTIVFKKNTSAVASAKYKFYNVFPESVRNTNKVEFIDSTVALMNTNYKGPQYIMDNVILNLQGKIGTEDINTYKFDELYVRSDSGTPKLTASIDLDMQNEKADNLYLTAAGKINSSGIISGQFDYYINDIVFMNMAAAVSGEAVILDVPTGTVNSVTINDDVCAEIVEKKSRFIANIFYRF